MFSLETACWYAGGAGAAALIHTKDTEIRDAAVGAPPNSVPTEFPGASAYGSPGGQYSMAVAWWIVGHATGSARGAAAGRDLLRAQINATTMTYADQVRD